MEGFYNKILMGEGFAFKLFLRFLKKYRNLSGEREIVFRALFLF
jgi:hypothetical protein